VRVIKKVGTKIAIANAVPSRGKFFFIFFSEKFLSGSVNEIFLYRDFYFANQILLYYLAFSGIKFYSSISLFILTQTFTLRKI